jgi:hypothetical protein
MSNIFGILQSPQYRLVCFMYFFISVKWADDYLYHHWQRRVRELQTLRPLDANACRILLLEQAVSKQRN